MSETAHSTECGAEWSNGPMCADHLDLMGFWELDHRLFDVHHLMVLCYHLQHPSLYSPQGLKDAQRLLVQFLEAGVTPQTARTRNRRTADSGRRTYKISGTADSHGEYTHPMRWTMTAADVIAGGMDSYYANVRAWAQSVLKSLKESGNLSSP